MTSRRPPTFVAAIAACIGTAMLAVPASSIAPADQSAAQASAQGRLEPEAVAALRRMSSYLMGLKTIEITSEGSLDVVTVEGQRVQLDGVTRYKVRRPGFVIDYSSDLKTRRFIYDGKNFTVVSPKLGFYASVPAPATNREVLDLIYERYGIRLPLEDLFRWNDPSSDRAESLRSGYKLGTATLGGVATDHYAFREDAIDWEIWIQQGSKPLPRKVVIIDRTQTERPTFIARLSWKENAPLTDADFRFNPGTAKRIDVATFEGTGG